MENGERNDDAQEQEVDVVEEEKQGESNDASNLHTPLMDRKPLENGVHENGDEIEPMEEHPPSDHVSELILHTALQNGATPYLLTPMAGGKRSLWVRFKHGRPTEVEVEESDVHVDHLKKRLKTLFPRHLGHLEAFEFSVKLISTDNEVVPEDLPIDILRTANKAGSPLFVETPDFAAGTPIRRLGGSRSPFTSPIPYTSPVESGPSPLLGNLQGTKIEPITGGLLAAANSAETEGQGFKLRARIPASFGQDARKCSAQKKAADGLSKGHAVVLLLNGEEVGKARIVSCERGGHCKLRLRSYAGTGNTMTPDGKLFRELGTEEFIWPRSDCRRDYKNSEASE